MNLKSEYIKLSSSQRIYELEVPIVGITGGIATGKSSSVDYIKSKGIQVICADTIIKNIYKEPETVQFIESVSPNVISMGKINFDKLRVDFFSNAELKVKIEDFLYLKLKKYFLKEASQILKKQNFLIYDVPLLFEKKLNSLFDLVVLIYAPRDKQYARVKNRDNSDEKTINNILDIQLNIDQKAEQADIVIENTSTLEELKDSLDQLIVQLLDTDS